MKNLLIVTLENQQIKKNLLIVTLENQQIKKNLFYIFYSKARDSYFYISSLYREKKKIETKEK